MSDFDMPIHMVVMMYLGYVQPLLVDALLVAGFILLIEVIKYLRKLNKRLIVDNRYTKTENKEPKCDIQTD